MDKLIHILRAIAVFIFIFGAIAIGYLFQNQWEEEARLNYERCQNGVYAPDSPHCMGFWEYLMYGKRQKEMEEQ